MLSTSTMTDDETPITSLLDRVEDYGRTTLELCKLHAVGASAEVASSICTRLIISMVVVFSTLILSVGLALWIGSLLGDAFYGFFIVGGFYAIVAILLGAFRKRLVQRPISNSIIKLLLNIDLRDV